MSEQVSIDFTGVSEATNVYPERLTPGVYEEMTISGWEFGTQDNEKKTPYATVTVLAEGAEHKEKFFLTTGALPRLKHLLNAAGVPESVTSGKMSAEQLTKASTGKRFHGRLNGREYINKNGELKVAAEFSFSGFALPFNEPNTLVFNPDRHIERLPSDAKSAVSTGEKLTAPSLTTNDLPF